MNYFKSNHIKSITLKDNKLIIKYQNKEEEEDLNSTEKQLIQAYCQKLGVNSLSLSDLQQQQIQSPQGLNWKSPWVIGTGLVLVGGMVGLVVYFTRKNKE